MIFQDGFRAAGLDDIREKVLSGERLTIEDGEKLFACPDPTVVGALAHHVRTRMHGDRTFYILNQHINYTNVCVNGCLFCAYNREQGQEGAFELDRDDILEKVRANPMVPREIHIVGGCHPGLGLDYFKDMLEGLRDELPGVVLKCFTAVEIQHFADIESMTSREVLIELQKSGLSMLPGGGAEIFAPEVRNRICPKKISGRAWLDIHREAHELGMHTNCTMLFGHLESERDRLEHLDALRTLQDDSAGGSGGFTCFIPLPFLTENSLLDIPRPLTGIDELKTIAVSRLMLDNIPHIKAYWIMLTVKQAQAALYFGADDFDGTVVEEKIGHMAGADSQQGLTRDELTEMIRGCGFTPVERDSFFNEVSA